MIVQAQLPLHDYLLGQLYEGVMAPDGFHAFLSAITTLAGLKSAGMQIRHRDTQESRGVWLHQISEQAMAEYSLGYYREDMLAQHLMTAPAARFYASNLDLPADLVESRFYREWVVPQGMAYAAASVVLREGPWLTQMFVQRGPEHGPFTRAEVDQFDLLVPHVQRAIQMRQRFIELDFTNKLLANSLDGFSMPTMMMGECGRTLYANRAAQAFLGGADGLQVEDGRLRCADRSANERMVTELSNAARASRGEPAQLKGVVTVPRTPRKPLVLMITPVGHEQVDALVQPRQGAALVFVFDMEAAPAVSTALASELFGLSAAEAQLASGLCAGKDLESIAAERNTSIHTVRGQLKSVFAKTGTSRQADLVAILLASPAYFRAAPPA